MKFRVILACLCLVAVHDIQGQVSPNPWRTVRILHRTGASDAVVFANGARLNTPLRRLTVLGTLPRRVGAPFVIVSGYGCDDCDDMRNIYVFAADAGTVKEIPPYRYYPGTITSSEDIKPFARVRVFVGNCGGDSTAAVVWITRMRDSLGTWRAITTTTSVNGDSLLDRNSSGLERQLRAALAAVRVHRCREIAGMDQTEY